MQSKAAKAVIKRRENYHRSWKGNTIFSSWNKYWYTDVVVLAVVLSSELLEQQVLAGYGYWCLSATRYVAAMQSQVVTLFVALLVERGRRNLLAGRVSQLLQILLWSCQQLHVM